MLSCMSFGVEFEETVPRQDLAETNCRDADTIPIDDETIASSRTGCTLHEPGRLLDYESANTC